MYNQWIYLKGCTIKNVHSDFYSLSQYLSSTIISKYPINYEAKGQNRKISYAVKPGYYKKKSYFEGFYFGPKSYDHVDGELIEMDCMCVDALEQGTDNPLNKAK